MPGAYQAIVIGAGHNGLTCACYLARAGLKVLVLEHYETYGGMTISEEIAVPDFLSDVHASGYLVAKLTPAPEELGLARHGLDLITPDPNWAQVFPDGRAVTIGRNVEETVRSMATFSRADAEAWRGLYGRYLAAKPEIVAGLTSTPPPLAKEFVCRVCATASSPARFSHPLDYERRIISAVHGTHQHGAFLPYQVGAMRPIPEFGSYLSPISNLYLCGAGSHPGSGVTMAPERNAAKVICGDRGLTFAVKPRKCHGQSA